MTTMTTTPSPARDYCERVDAAAAEYIARRNGESRLDGWVSRFGVWRPDAAEVRACCPDPYAAHYDGTGMRCHLRGFVHIAHLYGVTYEDVRVAVAAIRGER